jgi:hypothetical protein
MGDTTAKYIVDGQQMEPYLKSRFISVVITCSIVVTIVLAMLSYNFYKQSPKGPWSLLFSVPLIIGAFLFGVRRWHNKLRRLSGTEFLLTSYGITQTRLNQVERDISFSEMAVVDKKKFGTTILKGNGWTKIDYYRPKRPYQLDDPRLIFVPSITTNYAELIEKLKQQRHLR